MLWLLDDDESLFSFLSLDFFFFRLCPRVELVPALLVVLSFSVVVFPFLRAAEDDCDDVLGVGLPNLFLLFPELEVFF